MRHCLLVLFAIMIASTGSALAVPAKKKPTPSDVPLAKQSNTKKWKEHFDAGSDARKSGRFKEAEDEYKLALKAAQELGSEDRRVPETLKALGWLYYFEGRYKDSEPFFLKSLDLDRKILGEKSIEVVSTLDILGRLNRHLTRYSKAEQYQLQALDVRAGVAGDDEPNRNTLLHNLARVYAASGRRASDAEDIYLSAIKSEREKLNDSISSLATYQNNLGMLYAEHKKFDAAQEYLSKALLTLRLLPSRERELRSANIASNLGSIYFNQKSYKSAASTFKLALDVYSKYAIANPKTVATTVNNYILALKAIGEDAEAVKVAETYKTQLSSLTVSDPRIQPTNIRESVLKVLVAEYPKDLAFMKDDMAGAKDPKNARTIVSTYLAYIFKCVVENKRPSFIAEDYWARIASLFKAKRVNDALSLAMRPEEGDDSQINIPRVVDSDTRKR